MTLGLARDLVGTARALWPGENVWRALGSSVDAAVVSLHHGLDADVLGAAVGLVSAGGLLVLCAPDGPPPQPALAVHPFAAGDVGNRLWRRVVDRLSALDDGQPWTPPEPRTTTGSEEQASVVARLIERLGGEGRPARIALLADRGRGKSSALGLAARDLVARGKRVLVTAPHADAAVEVCRFAGPQVRFVDPQQVGRGPLDADVVVVDEAAQQPIPWLRALVGAHPATHFAFATTTQGYEGTGRGFVLRFLAALPDVEVLRLRTPIRWDEDDPLETAVAAALLLDVDLPETAPCALAPHLQRSTPLVLDRDAMAADEDLLRSLFGLLVQAHYRTTPGDLHRLLDAPNLTTHAIVQGKRVLAAALVAREGGLPPSTCARLARGQGRIRGHALADTLITHAQRPDAGAMALVRSVRITTDPGVRRQSLARVLVEHVHATYAADLFGTVFGATAALVRFRQAMGYVVVRVGTARGARSGEPSVVMVRAASAAGAVLVEALRADLARDLPLQVRLLDQGGDVGLDPDLVAALEADLPPALPLSEDDVLGRVRRYLHGPQTFEAAVWAVSRFVAAADLAVLDPPARAVVCGRVLEARPWEAVAAAAGVSSAPAAMRLLRPAIGSLWQATVRPPFARPPNDG